MAGAKKRSAVAKGAKAFSTAEAGDAADNPPGDRDAIALLMADHLRVVRLFARFNKLEDGGDDEEKARLVAQICRELTIHTQIEEEIFYPAARKAIDDDDLMDEAWVEHAGAKSLLAQLAAAEPDDDFYDAKVRVLAEQIDHHVQEEEKDMFPQVRQSDLDTLTLGAQLLSRRTELLNVMEATAVATDRARKPAKRNVSTTKQTKRR